MSSSLSSSIADGTVAIDLDPLSRLCRLAASVPAPGRHAVRYAGVLASASKLRPRIVPKPPEVEGGQDACEPSPPKRAGCRYRSWAELLLRTRGEKLHAGKRFRRIASGWLHQLVDLAPAATACNPRFVSVVSITVFTRESLASVTTDALVRGIGVRLALLTSLYCPADEEKPAAVLARLRIVPQEPRGDDFATWSLRYGRAHNAVIRIDRTTKHSPATPFRRAGEEDVAYMARIFHELEPRGRREALDVLDQAHDVVAVVMTKRAAQTTAWPVGVAAGAWLAARGSGVLFVPGSGWLVPTPKEVREAH